MEHLGTVKQNILGLDGHIDDMIKEMSDARANIRDLWSLYHGIVDQLCNEV